MFAKMTRARITVLAKRVTLHFNHLVEGPVGSASSYPCLLWPSEHEASQLDD